MSFIFEQMFQGQEFQFIVHAFINSLSQPMKGAMVRKICDHLNPEAKRYIFSKLAKFIGKL